MKNIYRASKKTPTRVPGGTGSTGKSISAATTPKNRNLCRVRHSGERTEKKGPGKGGEEAKQAPRPESSTEKKINVPRRSMGSYGSEEQNYAEQKRSKGCVHSEKGKQEPVEYTTENKDP